VRAGLCIFCWRCASIVFAFCILSQCCAGVGPGWLCFFLFVFCALVVRAGAANGTRLDIGPTLCVAL